MKLTKEKILNEKFESVINGYSPTRVDLFLDSIIQDYDEYNNKIKELETQNQELNKTIETQQSEIETLKQKIVELQKTQSE